jgi:hypothetical protein
MPFNKVKKVALPLKGLIVKIITIQNSVYRQTVKMEYQ